MDSSTNSSIHALPENHMNDVVGKLNDINDEIATFSRGLDNLTEELQKTSLDDIGQRSLVESFFPNHTNGIDADLSVEPEHSIQTTNGIESSVLRDHSYATSNGNVNGLNGDCGIEMRTADCDVVDSSPKYTQYNDYLGNSSNMIAASNGYACHSSNDRYNSPTADDGICDDPFLRSVDLRGKICIQFIIFKYGNIRL